MMPRQKMGTDKGRKEDQETPMSLATFLHLAGTASYPKRPTVTPRLTCPTASPP